MEVTQMNAVHHLVHHPGLNCIDRGRRGTGDALGQQNMSPEVAPS